MFAGALLVLALYGGSRLDVFSLELMPGGSTPNEASIGAFSAKTEAASPTPTLAPTRTATPPPTLVALTATPEPSATPEPTETPEPDPTETPEPEPTETPEPTATPEPTQTPLPPTATATSLPPTATATVSVALGVPVTRTATGSTPAATATKAPAQAPAQTPAAFTGSFSGYATPYWDGLAGNVMGCGVVYSPTDTTVLAVSPAYYGSIPCGTTLKVCGTVGCIDVVRSDSCPGCEGTHIDLSRAGFNLVCGPAANNCNVTVTKR